MKTRSYTETQLINAVKESTSVRQVLSKLGLKEAGGNYQTIRKYVKELGLDTSHFSGQAWNKNQKIGHKRPIEDYLSNKQPIKSYKLKKRLLDCGFLKPICSCCKKRTWLGNQIPLELDHIDGNTDNNLLKNLRLLCPNCHALTPTYRGKNKGSYST